MYAGLAAALGSFALTFGVAPRFKSHFKEADAWKDMYEVLRGCAVKSYTPVEAAAKARRGCGTHDTLVAAYDAVCAHMRACVRTQMPAQKLGPSG